MSKYLLAFFCSFTFFTSYAQQLVLNGGHESYTGKTGNGTYPTDTCRRELLTLGTVVPAFNLPNPIGIAAVCASPDHLCTDPNQGKAHGGLFFYPKIEIPQYQLCAPMIPGKRYFVSYQIKLQPGAHYAVDQVSTLFGQWGSDCKTASTIVNPKHTTTKGAFVENQNSYQKISFEFVADSAYTAMMIGNFMTKGSPKGSDFKVVNASNPNKLAYYYLDDLSVKPDITIHGDSSVCSQAEFRVWIENNVSCNKSVVWKEKGKDEQLGLSDTLQLSINSTKTFWAIVEDDTLEKTIKVLNTLPLSLGPDSSYCDEDEVLLDAGIRPGATYKWQSGSTGSSLKVIQNGIYTIEINDGGCLLFDTVRIFLGKIGLDLGKDTVICGKKSYSIDPQVLNNVEYLWQDSSVSKTLTVTKSGLYRVTITSGECVFADSLAVEFAVADIDSAFKVPNAFSPNGDQVNDQFELILNTKVYQYELFVFDRFGNLVFKNDDSKVFWDGRTSNEIAPAEVYTWVCKLEVDACGKRTKTIKKGEVVLLR